MMTATHPVTETSVATPETASAVPVATPQQTPKRDLG